LIARKEEIETVHITFKGILRKIPLYDYSELKIVDEVLNQAKKKNNLNKMSRKMKK